ncbi:MAG: DciA family protein [Armatimonadota bacterium]
MRRGGVSPMAELLGGRLRDSEFARKIGEHTAPLVWAEVVGETIAAVTEVISVDHGVLRVSAKSAAWAQELTFLRGDLLVRLNQRLGAPAGRPFVRELHFVNRGIRRTASPPPSAPDDVDAISLTSDDEASIARLGAEIQDESMRERVREARRRDVKLRIWRIEHGWSPCVRCGDPVPPGSDDEVGVCPRCRLQT